MLKAVGLNFFSALDKIIENKTGIDTKKIRDVIIEGNEVAAKEIDKEHCYDVNFSFKKALKKAKGNNLVVFLFFLLVSCSLWFSLTLNRIYETDISVSVRVENVPNGVLLENGGEMPLRMVVRGEGTALFGYFFNDGVFHLAQAGELGQIVLGSDITNPVKPYIDGYKKSLAQKICIVPYEEKNQIWFFIPQKMLKT